MNFTQVGVLQSHTGQQARHTLVRAASANFLTAGGIVDFSGRCNDDIGC